MMKKSNLLITVLGASLVLGATGCGSDAPSTAKKPRNTASHQQTDDQRGGGTGDPKRDDAGDKATPLAAKRSAAGLLRDSIKALQASGTWHISVRGIIEVDADASGNCAGTFTNEGSTTKIIKKGGEIWVKPDESFWGQQYGKSVLSKLPKARGKYLYAPSASTSMITFVPGSACSMGDANVLTKGVREAGSPTKGPMTAIGGKKVLPLRVVDGKHKSVVTFYVAAEGTPYPLRVTSTGKNETSVDFSDFGKPFTAPPSPPKTASLSASAVDDAAMDASG